MKRALVLWLIGIGAGCGSAGEGGAPAGGPAAGGPGAGGSGGAPSGAAPSGGASALGGSAGVAPVGGGAPGASGGGAPAAGGAGGALELRVVSGNYQMVPEMYPAGEPLVVEALSAGAPAAGVVLSWKISEGWAGLGKLETVTDAQGRSENTFIGNYVPPNVSFTRQKVGVSAGAVSAQLEMTTCDTGTGAPVMPLAVLEAPEGKNVGSAKAGSVLPGAVKVRVVNQAGPYVGTALSGIGVRVEGPLGVRCQGDVVLTDDKGLATCNLEVGSQPGDKPFRVKIGGAVEYDGVLLSVAP